MKRLLKMMPSIVILGRQRTGAVTETTRFVGSFGADGDTIAVHLDLLHEGATWLPWMDIGLTKRS